ncbi:hypothetical protein A9K97_gp441 [Tokyovirus A1]|uniref:hypothetical protein n=1 Tax=Tokyovirus A1 TaxID=1826170 RepID=UPI0007A975D3|nr:hypothetical protein A9K97_gp441 [Tokyovirus A1]BAU79910.1 hypothetical protein [Tokyovirus A1]
MDSVLLPKVLDILEEFLVQRNEVSIEKQEDFHVFTEFCGSLCYWQENDDGTFREDSESLSVSEEEMLEYLRSRLETHGRLRTLHERRKRNVPGFHLESVLLPLVLPRIIEEFCLEESDIGVSYALNPGEEPSLEDLDNNSTWVTIHPKDSKQEICRWLEEDLGDRVRFSGEDEVLYWPSAKEAVEDILLRATDSPATFALALRNLKKTKQEIAELKRKNEKLRDRVLKYKFAPGSEKVQELQRHFSQLAE